MAAKKNILGRLLMCPECGHIHYGVSQKYIRKWKKEIRDYFLRLPEDTVKEYYGIIPDEPSADIYLKCFRCGFSELEKFLTPVSAPLGVTVQPILDPEL